MTLYKHIFRERMVVGDAQFTVQMLFGTPE